MSKQRGKASTASVTVRTISDVSGEVNITARTITSSKLTTGLSAAYTKQLFDQLYAQIDASSKVPSAIKEHVKAEAQDIQAAVKDAAEQKAPVDESFLARRFRNIARMAPDILDVVVASLGNPLAGLGVAAKKIAEKAKQDTSTA